MYVPGQAAAEPASAGAVRASAPGLSESAAPAPPGRESGASNGAGRAGAIGTTRAAEAISAVLGGLGALARLSAADLPGAGQADCLRALERAESMLITARSAVLAGFTASRAFQDDGQYSPKTWLVAQTRVTRAAAGGSVTWMRRLAGHPAVAGELTAGEISGSWARHLCDWTDRLPPASRDAADRILLAAAADGAALADLAALAEEMFRRCAPPDGDGRGDPASRGVLLDTHFHGAGKLDGDLTPRCAAALSAILESLGRKQGPEDRRTLPQRYHDALEEACRRLIAAGGLPDRAGQPTQIQLHMTLDELMRLSGAGSEADGSDTRSGGGDASGGGDRAAAPGWPGGRLPGPSAGPGAACDATIVPVVTGRVDPVLLDQLAAQLVDRDAAATLRFVGTAGDQASPAGPAAGGTPAVPGAAPGTPAPVVPAPVRSTPPDARQTARDLVLAQAVRLLSGPGGLAAALRAGVPFRPAASASLPLDTGAAADTVPPHLRRAVIVRDRTCRFPGCQQPPAACDVHHVVWRSRGGRDQLVNLVLLCRFHHLIAIHQWGWTITLHSDATVTAVSPDRRRTHRSHSPPAAAAA
jgi:Domain of unknown function (DUF222)